MKKRYDLLILAVATITISVLAKVAFILKFGPIKIVTQIISFVLTLVLCYYIYKEKQWARWLFIVLFTFSGLAGLISILKIGPTIESIPLIAMGLFYIGAGIYLGFIRKWNK